MKTKFLILVVSFFSTIVYYYSSIYIPFYSFNFNLIDIDRYPEWWKWSPSVLSLIASLIVLLLAYFYVNILRKKRLIIISSESKKEIKNIALLFLSVLSGISFVLVQHFIYSFFFTEKISSGINSFELWVLPSLIATCCVYPIAEELFFRKGILNLLHPNFKLIVSICLSSILFACTHFPNYRQIITTFVGGVLLGLLYKKTNKLIYPIAFHISWNTTVIVFNFIPIF